MDASRRQFLGGLLAALPAAALGSPKTGKSTICARQPFNACKLWIWAAANTEVVDESFMKTVNSLGIKECGIKKYKPDPAGFDWQACADYAQADMAQTYLLRKLGLRMRLDVNGNDHLLQVFVNRDSAGNKIFDRNQWFIHILEKANMSPPDGK